MNPHKEEAQKLVNYSIELLGIQYDSDGKVMNRQRCLPKARMIARSHIRMAKSAIEDPYWQKIEDELDLCI